MLKISAATRSEAAALPTEEGELVYRNESFLHLVTDGELLAVAKAGTGLPFGIEVPYQTDWRALPLSVGDPVRWTADTVRIGSALEVTALSSCRTYAHRVEAQETGLSPAVLQELHALTREEEPRGIAVELAALFDESGRELIFEETEEMSPAARAVLRLVRGGGGRASLAETADALIGRGRGSTPAGDDFLSGLYGAILFGGAAWEGARNMLREEIRARLSRTTRLSATYMSYLLDGVWHKGVADFLRAARDASPLLPRRARMLLSYGHSSGSDFLQGFLIGGHWMTKAAANRT
ncbi:hypothetical protein TAMA11512_01900 [Selenomonas sp. TAMA-11512]|uniref:oxamate carbamoyltransferase subunit AllH family protein n=1 Tax=Selenomonas sp. TAMA-11512 TaxID=3095337 RepID=UPI00308A044E|nr:hypothetical protein TAMA11512_01900 [Selenomonas sp. TAMA-11512]